MCPLPFLRKLYVLLDSEPLRLLVDSETWIGMTMKMPCPKCAWRNRVLPPDEEEDGEEECHTPLGHLHLSGRSWPNIRIMFAMHEELPGLWRDICNTDKLNPGSFCTENKRWFRFPLRHMNRMSADPSLPLQALTEKIEDYERNIIHGGFGYFTMYHCVNLQNLVRGHEKSPGSSGILCDGGMRYGCDHGDGIGVYCHASRPDALFLEHDGRCFLELRCHRSLTKVEGGSRGRYVLKSDQTTQSKGALCTDCQVVAMFHLYGSLPEFMKF